MVVASIIGILAATLFASFEEGRQQSRDRVRMAELKELQLGVELYKAQNGVYPDQGCGTPGSQWAGSGPHSGWGVSCTPYIIGLVPNFIPDLPSDPNQEEEPNKGFIYMTNSSRTAYKIIVYDSVENQLVTSNDDEFSRYPSQCGYAVQSDEYAVYSAGAECW